MKALQHLNKYFVKYKWQLLLGILITIFAKIFSLFIPRLISQSVNVVDEYRKGAITDIAFVKSELFINILYIIGAAIITGILTFFMRQTIINVSRYVEYDLKNEVYQQYQRLSLSFYKSNRTGDLMNRISEDVSRVREYMGPAIMYSLNMITLFVVALIYMFSVAPKLTLYVVTQLPIL
jgi:ATP-binding cassette subfamily B protein